MSVRYSITGEQDGCQWPITSACVEGASRLSKAGFKRHLAAVCLDPDAELGEEALVQQAEALPALNELILAAKNVPKGLQVRTAAFWGDPENKEFQEQMKAFLRATGAGEEAEQDVVVRELIKVRIDGVYYTISCEQEQWRIQPMANRPVPAGKVVPEGMRGEPRQEPAEVDTENFGVVKVEVQEGRSDVEILLSRIKRFLSSTTDMSFRVFVG